MVRFGSTNISAFFGSVEVLLSGIEIKNTGTVGLSFSFPHLR
jgi:hypothetical protein